MRQSGDLNRIYWLFLSVFIMLIYTAIIFWDGAEFYWRILAGGIFSLINVAIFSVLRESQEKKEQKEDQQIAKELGQPYVHELPDGSKVHYDALPAPSQAVEETFYYCPRCKALKRAGQVWGGAPTNKLCMKCDSLTIPIINGTKILCSRCQVPNDVQTRNYCWKCQAVLPDVHKDKIKELQNIIQKEHEEAHSLLSSNSLTPGDEGNVGKA